MLFYPLWVLFYWFSCELAVPPLPVDVDKGWLKPRCGECVEHSFWQHHDYQVCMCVSLYVCTVYRCIMNQRSILASFTRKNYFNTIWETFTEAVNRWYCVLLLPVIQTNKNPCKKETSTPAFTWRYSHSPTPAPSLPVNFLCLPSVCLPAFTPLFPLFCPSVFLFPSLALIRLFFVSESWPPSCQLRQD